MDLSVVWQLFISFARANLLAYGGGPSAIPLVQAEVVQRGWMTKEQFGSALAAGNSLPGPIATKMAAYIGFQIGGPLGSLMALLGTVVPSALLMVGLAALLIRYQNVPMVNGMIKGVKAIVFVLFALLALDFFRFAWPLSAGWVAALVAVGGFVAIYFFQVNQAIAVLCAVIIGALFMR